METLLSVDAARPGRSWWTHPLSHFTQGQPVFGTGWPGPTAVTSLPGPWPLASALA